MTTVTPTIPGHPSPVAAVEAPTSGGLAAGPTPIGPAATSPPATPTGPS